MRKGSLVQFNNRFIDIISRLYGPVAVKGKVFFVQGVAVGETSLSREIFANQQQSHEDWKKKETNNKKRRKERKEIKDYQGTLLRINGSKFKEPTALFVERKQDSHSQLN